MALYLYDPIYHDRDFMLLIISLNNRTGDGEWIGVDSEALLLPFNKGREVGECNCASTQNKPRQ